MRSLRLLKDCSKTGKQLSSSTIISNSTSSTTPAAAATTTTISSINPTDFFGILDITSKDIAGAFRTVGKPPREEIDRKYLPLNNKRDELMSKVYETSAVFGTIRLDRDNVPIIHGQYEKTNRRLLDTVQIKQKFMPDQETNNKNTEELEDKNSQKSTEEYIETSKIEGYKQAYKISEVEPLVNINEAISIFREDLREDAENINKYANQSPLTFFFKRNSILTTQNRRIENCNYDNARQCTQEKPSDEPTGKLSGRKLGDKELEESIAEAVNPNVLKPTLEYNFEKDEPPLEDVELDFEGRIEENSARERKFSWEDSIDKEFDETNPITAKRPRTNALEYLKSIRAHKIEPESMILKERYRKVDDSPLSFKSAMKLDSQGYRDYRDQVPDWTKFRRNELIDFMKKSIIYDNNGIVALNKPYGLACHHEEFLPNHYDINSLMQEVAKELKHEELFLVHRLDKTTTGILIFATNQKMANTLNKKFKAGEVSKTYLCIVRGFPREERALIDIPIGEFRLAGKVRSCLCPEKVEPERQFAKRYREARRAVTEYRVLQSVRGASLVEVKPRTGVKHQIRCHLSFGIGTPILGDHKYSALEKIAPQQLPVPVLKALQLRQSKTRTLPLHLHARLTVIPNAKANGESLFLKAPLPNHMTENMRSLKFKTFEKALKY